MKEVEGDFGTGVVAYFLFIKWLMFLNLGVCIIMVVFIVLPAMLLVSILSSFHSVLGLKFLETFYL